MHRLDGTNKFDNIVYCDALGSVFPGVNDVPYRQHRWNGSNAMLSVRRLVMFSSVHERPLGDISTVTVPMIAAVLNQVAIVRITAENFRGGTESPFLGSVIHTVANDDYFIMMLTSCAPMPIVSVWVRFSTLYPSCMNNIETTG